MYSVYVCVYMHIYIFIYICIYIYIGGTVYVISYGEYNFISYIFVRANYFYLVVHSIAFGFVWGIDVKINL